jgi:hypothetical protein
VLVKVGELSVKLAGPALADVREGDLDLEGLAASRVREGLFLVSRLKLSEYSHLTLASVLCAVAKG